MQTVATRKAQSQQAAAATLIPQATAAHARPMRGARLARLSALFDATLLAPGIIIVALALALIGQAVGAHALDAIAPLLATALLAVSLWRPEARRAIQLHLLAAAVVAYALLNGVAGLAGILALRAGPPVALLAQIAAGLAPAITSPACYFVGVTLSAPIARRSAWSRQQPSPPAAPTAYAQLSPPPNTRLTLAMTRLACALVGVALPLAGWAMWRAMATQWRGAPLAAPASVGLANPATLANLLALAVVVASASDAPNATLRFLLGASPRALAPDRRARAWLAGAYRTLLAICVPLGALALVAGIALTWSRTALLATGAALLVVSVARRRFGRLVVFALALAVVLALTPRGFSGWFGASFVVNAANLSSAQAPTFMARLAALTVMGLAMARLWVAYGRLRPASGAAGVTLAALGAMIYTLVASMTSMPLSEPVVGVVCWLLLGMASGVGDALEQSAQSMRHAKQPSGARATQSGQTDHLVDGVTLAARAIVADAARAYPLRAHFILDTAASAETRIALAETIRAFDRRRVAPQVMTLAPINTEAQTSVVRGRARAKRSGRRLLPDSLRQCIGMWHSWTELLRGALDAQPDLLIAASPGAYLPTIFAGRLIGVPVQWHAREIAPPELQLALDTFAPWTAGVIACSQYVARSFQIEALGARLRVVRQGVIAPAPLVEEQRQALRAALGVGDADPLMIYPGEIVSGSGHADLIQALRIVRARYPRAQLLLVSEATDGEENTNAQYERDEGVATTPTTNANLCDLICADPRQEQRLACAISLNQLNGAIRSLGARADLSAVIGACDLAVFPQWAAPFSRGLTLALAQGVPIVAVQAGALPEQLADAWGCLLAPPRDPAALAQTLCQAIARLGALRDQARHNRTLARDWHSASLEAARLKTLYRQICLPAGRARQRNRGTLQRAWGAALWGSPA